MQEVTQSNNEFLSGVQDKPMESAGSFFFKPENGSTTVRLVTKPFQFYSIWTEELPGERAKLAHRKFDQLMEHQTADEKVKLTWGLVVWNYAEGKLMAWELTQKTIINQLITLANAGTSMMDRDLTIIRSGEKLQTKYQIVPAAPSEVEPAIAEILKDAVINMDGFVDEGIEIVKGE